MLPKALTLKEISDQEKDEVRGNVGPEEVVLVLRGPIGPRSNLR